MRIITYASLAAALALTSGCSETHDERADVMREVEASVASLDERLEALGARLRNDDIEAEYHDLMAKLEEQRVKLSDRLSDAASASEEKWDEVVDDLKAKCRDIEAEANSLLEKLDDDT